MVTETVFSSVSYLLDDGGGVRNNIFLNVAWMGVRMGVRLGVSVGFRMSLVDVMLRVVSLSRSSNSTETMFFGRTWFLKQKNVITIYLFLYICDASLPTILKSIDYVIILY